MEQRAIVVNRCFGGFGLSEKAKARYAELKGVPACDVYSHAIERDDPCLIQAVREIGVENARDEYARLEVVEIPADVAWEIDEYDGQEMIREKSRTW